MCLLARSSMTLTSPPRSLFTSFSSSPVPNTHVLARNQVVWCHSLVGWGIPVVYPVATSSLEWDCGLAEDHQTRADYSLKHTHVGLKCLLIGCHAIRVLYINLAEDHRTRANYSLITHTHTDISCLVIWIVY